jgi:hypothetical protein
MGNGFSRANSEEGEAILAPPSRSNKVVIRIFLFITGSNSRFLNIFGIVFLTAGILLHIWTGKLLGLRGLVGLPEILSKVKGRLATEGPFSIVKHPTYFAHTTMFLGIFLFTEVIAIGIITFFDPNNQYHNSSIGRQRTYTTFWHGLLRRIQEACSPEIHPRDFVICLLI